MPQSPEQQAAMAVAFREYLSVHPALDLSGHLKDEISRALVGVAADFIDALPISSSTAIELIAQEWDDCIYEAPGEDIDIGASIRRAAARIERSNAEAQVADAHTSNAALPTYSALLALAQRLAYPDAGELLILEDYRNIARNVVQPGSHEHAAAGR